jgi:hypothetical protein
MNDRRLRRDLGPRYRVLLLVHSSDEATHRLVQRLKAVQNGIRNSRRRRRWRSIRGDSRDHITRSEGDDRRLSNRRRPDRRMVSLSVIG